MAIADDAFDLMMAVLHDEVKRMEFIAYMLIFCALSSFVCLQFLSAPYGRYTRQGWGFEVPGRLAWFVQELPSFTIPLLLLIFTDCSRARQWQNQVALGLFLFHYFQRTFVFSYLIKGGKPTPFITFSMAFSFCVLNGYLQGGYLLKYADLSSTCSVQFYAGIVVFLSGLFINIQSDHILRNLRKGGETGYKIPHGGMFQYVSGANFFGETLEWTGFALLCGTLPAVTFAIFTACNIGPRACQHHRWYQEKFEDYPKNRKAFIPFIL